MTNETKTALEYLSSILLWAENGISMAPRGVTVPCLKSAEEAIRSALTAASVADELAGALQKFVDIYQDSMSLHFGPKHTDQIIAALSRHNKAKA